MKVRATRSFAGIRVGTVLDVDPDGAMAGYLRTGYLTEVPESPAVAVSAPAVELTPAAPAPEPEPAPRRKSARGKR